MVVYDPIRWNSSAVVWQNNCYNYAINKLSNDYLQPGSMAGNRTGIPYEKAKLDRAAQADGLKRISARFRKQDIPEGYHVVWFAIRPGYSGDYHWYRLDHNGTWSHKMGPAPAINTDGYDNKLIRNPKTHAASIGYTVPGYYYLSRDTW